MNDLIELHLQWAKAAKYAATTLEIREVVLRLADRQLPYGLNAIADEIEVWLGNSTARRNGKDDPWKAKTCALYFWHLSEFYTWGVRCGRMEANPMVWLKRPTVPPAEPRPCTNTQVTILLGARQPHRLGVVLAAYAGLRCCEIARLTPADVDQDYIRVRGKGGKVATVDMHPRVWAELADFPGSAPFFVQAGGRANARSVSCDAAKYFRHTLGVPVTMHQLRHWYVTCVYEEEGLEVARQAARHRSLISTQGYAQLRNGQRRRGILALPVLDSATR
jgi:integrase/recombinase XerD